MRAILSVHDKTNIEKLAGGLGKLGFEVFSTGGTKKALEEKGITAGSISEITGFPEILDGRVKTLHPAVHAGILARRDSPEQMKEVERLGIKTIELLAINLYPFAETVRKEGTTEGDALENIDIGGPTMLRAGAKNFPWVMVLVDPNDYTEALERIREGRDDLEYRRYLAAKAFRHTACYDSLVARYLGTETFPEELPLSFSRRYTLRYGENPHQEAAFYAENSIKKENTGITYARQLWGKELSFNNILDADAAWEVVTDFDEEAVTIVKHTNPCGLCCHPDMEKAYAGAYRGDPVSAYGGIVAANRRITVEAARLIGRTFYEIVIAPGFDDDALEELKRKKNLRILLADLPPDYGGEPASYFDYRRVRGGLLVQLGDSIVEDKSSYRVVTRRKPTDKEWQDLLFAWKAVKHIKSNAIVLAKEKTLLGMGAGQPNRVTSVRLSSERAGEEARGSVMASDAMFPFADSVEEAAKVGVSAVIQPGGSIRDGESVEMADKFNIAMVFTGIRHFRH